MQVAFVDPVVVDDRDLDAARSDEQAKHRRGKTASADHQNREIVAHSKYSPKLK
jgi:hypothetical protein